MTNTQLFLDKARQMCQPPTWYRLAKTLELNHATITRCNRRGGTLDNAAVIKLAKFLGQPLDQLLPLIELDRAKTEKQRNFWERYAPRVLPPVAFAAALAVSGSGRANAAVRRTSHWFVTQTIPYAKYAYGSQVDLAGDICRSISPLTARRSVMRQLARVTMSMRELDRLKGIQGIVDGDLKPIRAAERLGLSTRQVRRLASRYRAEGPIGLIARSRNRPSNNRLEPSLEAQVAEILRDQYPDFGPTLAAEKLSPALTGVETALLLRRVIHSKREI